MSDTPDRSMDLAVSPSSPPSVPISSEKREAYRPLSLLALFGFLVAVLFAGLVTVIGTLAFLGGTAQTGWVILSVLAIIVILGALLVGNMFGRKSFPDLLRFVGYGLLAVFAGPIALGGLLAFRDKAWLLPLWVLLLPLGAGLLSWVARYQIQNSENTLEGKALTSWGIGLSLYFGITYSSYFAGTWLAVQQQATEFTETWFKHIENNGPGEFERAFALTIDPGRRPDLDSPQLRLALENRFNLPTGPGTQGEFRNFSHKDYVRALRMADGKANIEQRDFSWERQPQGYFCQTRYNIETPYIQFVLLVMLRGRDVPGAGRQWTIMRGGTKIEEDSTQLTPEGQELLDQARVARGRVLIWANALRNTAWDDAYLAMLPPDQRKQHQGPGGAHPPRGFPVSVSTNPLVTGVAPGHTRKIVDMLDHGQWVVDLLGHNGLANGLLSGWTTALKNKQRFFRFDRDYYPETRTAEALRLI